jgi:hypothetical protein
VSVDELSKLSVNVMQKILMQKNKSVSYFQFKTNMQKKQQHGHIFQRKYIGRRKTINEKHQQELFSISHEQLAFHKSYHLNRYNGKSSVSQDG